MLKYFNARETSQPDSDHQRSAPDRLMMASELSDDPLHGKAKVEPYDNNDLSPPGSDRPALGPSYPNSFVNPVAKLPARPDLLRTAAKQICSLRQEQIGRIQSQITSWITPASKRQNKTSPPEEGELLDSSSPTLTAPPSHSTRSFMPIQDSLVRFREVFSSISIFGSRLLAFLQLRSPFLISKAAIF